MWLPVPVTPVLRMQRQEDHKFEASLDCRVRPPSQGNRAKQNKEAKRKGRRGETQQVQRTTGRALDKMAPALCRTHLAAKHHGQGMNQKASDMSVVPHVAPGQQRPVSSSLRLSELVSLPDLTTRSLCFVNQKTLSG